MNSWFTRANGLSAGIYLFVDALHNNRLFAH